MRTWAEECKVAESLRVNPPWYVREGNHCQQASRVIVGADAWGYPRTALGAWNAIPAEHKAFGKFIPGGISYWDDLRRTGEAGHAAWTFTSGRVYSTDILQFGRVSIVPYTYIHDRWGMRYLGTILWTPSGKISLPPATPVPVVSPWSKGDVYMSKLHYGQTASDSVKRLQYRLRALGYTAVTITGNYDNSTDAAVRAWQHRVGHPMDPIGHSFIGPVEFKMLFSSPPYIRHY
jgi:hypothetical protein